MTEYPRRTFYFLVCGGKIRCLVLSLFFFFLNSVIIVLIIFVYESMVTGLHLSEFSICKCFSSQVWILIAIWLIGLRHTLVRKFLRDWNREWWRQTLTPLMSQLKELVRFLWAICSAVTLTFVVQNYVLNSHVHRLKIFLI